MYIAILVNPTRDEAETFLSLQNHKLLEKTQKIIYLVTLQREM